MNEVVIFVILIDIEDDDKSLLQQPLAELALREPMQVPIIYGST